MGDSAGYQRDLRAEERDGRAGRRDDIDGERDSQAAARDRAARDRDAAAARVDWSARHHLATNKQRRAADAESRARRENAPDGDAHLEQGVIDRESLLTEIAMLEGEVLDVLDAARRQRWDAAHDRRDSSQDRLSAETSRDAAAEDRGAAASDRAAASGDRQQAEIDMVVALPPDSAGAL